MKELLQTKKCEAETGPVTPYQKAQAEWDRREGDARKHAKNWRVSALVSWATCLSLTFGMIYQSSKATVTPYVVQVNGEGVVQAVGLATQSNYIPKEPEIKFFLSQLVTKTRSIPSDAVVAKRNWLEVYAFLRETAALKMNEFMTQSNMAGRIGTETSQVEITVIVPLSKDSYQIRWKETTYDMQGTQKEEIKMTGLFTIELMPPKDEKSLAVNPLGLFVKDFSWSKEM